MKENYDIQKIQIIDNFLNELDLLSLKNNILDTTDNLWQFNPTCIFPYDKFNHEEGVPFQFVHGIYNKFVPTSKCFDYMKPFIKKLKVKSLLRIKVNLTTRTENIIESDLHVDNYLEREDFVNYKVGIFYLNTNNGYTFFETGQRVNSVENRMVIFDGSLLHGGTNCTDKQRRVVINFNYF